MTTAIEKPMLRWSSVRTCPRKAVLEATTQPDREWTPKEHGYMLRGKSIGRDFVLMLAAGNEADRKNALIYVDSGDDRWVPERLLTKDRSQAAFVAELRVPWEMGVGHVDCLVVETGTVIEVLSSAYDSQAHSKLLQATGYARKLDDATGVCLAIVSPSDMTADRVIVLKDTDQWTELEAEVDDRVAEVLGWEKTRDLPGRVCGKPSEAHGRFCRHAGTCFEGWQPEPLDTIAAQDTHEYVARLYHAKQKEREVKQTLAVVETERKEIEHHLDELVDAGEFQVGGFQIVKSPRTRESFKLTLAKKDSRLPASLLDEFTSVSSYTVWTVDRNGAGDVDAGEAPF